jgi:hypothetical protein
LLRGADVPDVTVLVPVPVGPVVKEVCCSEAEAIPVGVMLSLVEVALELDIDPEFVPEVELELHTRIGKPP